MKQLEVPLRLMNLYPPLVGAGIRIKEVSPAHDRVVVEMKLTWWNANFARTHFGGSLYMMIDPFYGSTRSCSNTSSDRATPSGTAR